MDNPQHNSLQCVVVKAALDLLERGIRRFMEKPGPVNATNLLKASVACHEILSDHFGAGKKFEDYMTVVPMLFPLEEPGEPVMTKEE